ncbi:Undecaprenyl-phosphate galactose phosphotransferase, WbaP/exopolysaccharide biosynthesis polyprenyl glycosylphosphotransferase [Geodermatophilus pulveris]|uniref:Undecaprenyl-phosphate galactose phosphotransferase, WbaP/exopolysaccharide biosynthesis polyprenyl glycosylphosphotransferase n=1 Tax=Geodermatophilus pulveris TaxID=1564159 RepID=A0A239J943_9ACTN|nr:sugar transferase [Geodermatophilus pulveris]SNT02018.1 Undecaprenyl-phosphate galactose phosphotransferase, WbaP/exopolysaccharide biosynthesis polyprenyl glycosylphosphotransferase [Geodermatophilus pulveris]
MTDTSAERLDDDLAPEPRTATSPALMPPPSPADDSREIRHLAEANTVPALSRTPVLPTRGRPVYDPFTARRRQTPEWLVAYTATLVMGDVVAAIAAACALMPFTGSISAHGLRLAAIGALAWPALLMSLSTYAERLHGTGAVEYRRVAIGGVVAVAAAGYAAQVPAFVGLTRLLLIGVPVATVLTLLNHALNRRRLHAARRRGLMTKRVVLVGRDSAVLDLAHRLRRDPACGLEVVGACVPQPPTTQSLERSQIAVLGDLTQVVRVVDEVGADAVVVASASETAGKYLRDLSWRLEGTRIDVLAAPGLLEVAPHRLQIRPTTSAPLLQIREPEFRGHRRVVKGVLDRVAATALLTLGLPLLVVIGAVVRFSSPGPALYRQRRVGKRGVCFDVLKFRSMVVDADRQLDGLLPQNEATVLFKMRRDPRVTPVGRFLRRFSLDELPQLVNVLKGQMSFVGPRPALEREVARYGPDMHRRLLVKPGITGLWQVSGRSNLSWDEAVELDIRYVENWSLGLDLAILLRTIRAVVRRAGAY